MAGGGESDEVHPGNDDTVGRHRVPLFREQCFRKQTIPRPVPPRRLWRPATRQLAMDNHTRCHATQNRSDGDPAEEHRLCESRVADRKRQPLLVGGRPELVLNGDLDHVLAGRRLGRELDL